MNIFDKSVDLNFFNKLLIKNGGKPMKTNEIKLKMRQFILKLIKVFYKDFNKNKKGGATNYGLVENSMKLGDLKFNDYSFPQYTLLEREEL